MRMVAWLKFYKGVLYIESYYRKYTQELQSHYNACDIFFNIPPRVILNTYIFPV